MLFEELVDGVVVPSAVGIERLKASGCVVVAGSVAKKRIVANGGIVISRCVAIECVDTVSGNGRK